MENQAVDTKKEDNARMKVVIMGGGLVGSLQAVYFAKRGIQVLLFEKRADIRTDTSQSGKSINLVYISNIRRFQLGVSKP